MKALLLSLLLAPTVAQEGLDDPVPVAVTEALSPEIVAGLERTAAQLDVGLDPAAALLQFPPCRLAVDVEEEGALIFEITRSEQVIVGLETDGDLAFAPNRPWRTEPVTDLSTVKARKDARLWLLAARAWRQRRPEQARALLDRMEGDPADARRQVTDHLFAAWGHLALWQAGQGDRFAARRLIGQLRGPLFRDADEHEVAEIWSAMLAGHEAVATRAPLPSLREWAQLAPTLDREGQVRFLAERLPLAHGDWRRVDGCPIPTTDMLEPCGALEAMNLGVDDLEPLAEKLATPGWADTATAVRMDGQLLLTAGHLAAWLVQQAATRPLAGPEAIRAFTEAHAGWPRERLLRETLREADAPDAAAAAMELGRSNKVAEAVMDRLAAAERPDQQAALLEALLVVGDRRAVGAAKPLLEDSAQALAFDVDGAFMNPGVSLDTETFDEVQAMRARGAVAAAVIALHSRRARLGVLDGIDERPNLFRWVRAARGERAARIDALDAARAAVASAVRWATEAPCCWSRVEVDLRAVPFRAVSTADLWLLAAQGEAEAWALAESLVADPLLTRWFGASIAAWRPEDEALPVGDWLAAQRGRVEAGDDPEVADPRPPTVVEPLRGARR
ncbi:MAG: hypothetical protein H6739_15925 [Alphaproteobacteria bacterium]|nr:hypothetical protein [Alphaproteobacteria bacterium]